MDDTDIGILIYNTYVDSVNMQDFKHRTIFKMVRYFSNNIYDDSGFSNIFHISTFI